MRRKGEKCHPRGKAVPGMPRSVAGVAVCWGLQLWGSNREAGAWRARGPGGGVGRLQTSRTENTGRRGF